MPRRTVGPVSCAGVWGLAPCWRSCSSARGQPAGKSPSSPSAKRSGALAFEAALQATDLGGYTCILSNDASTAIAAYRRGSTQSCPVQRCALYLSRLAAAANVDVLPGHVPGLQQVAEGIDGASRAGDDLGRGLNVQSALGPAVSDALWSKVQEVAASVGWRVTVDAFVFASNARAARYWSEFP